MLEFHEMLYGADVTGEPTFTLSTRNWTWLMVPPSFADALALSVTVPLTVELNAGAVTCTVGSAVLPLLTVTGIAALVAVPRDESVAIAVRRWLPLLDELVFHVVEYGADEVAALKLTPSSWNCTLEIVAPLEAEALALTVTVPLTLVPLAGDVIETEISGGVPLPDNVVNTWSPVVIAVPSASRDCTAK